MSYYNTRTCEHRSYEIMVGSVESGGPEHWRCELEEDHDGLHAAKDYGFWVTWTDEDRYPNVMPTGWHPDDQWADVV